LRAHTFNVVASRMHPSQRWMICGLMLEQHRKPKFYNLAFRCLIQSFVTFRAGSMRILLLVLLLRREWAARLLLQHPEATSKTVKLYFSLQPCAVLARMVYRQRC